jgi:hypothetical protein
LREAIACGGSSAKDFFAPDGTEGHYKQQHLVYGKEGQPCPNSCGQIIRRLQSECSSFAAPPVRFAKHHVDFVLSAIKIYTPYDLKKPKAILPRRIKLDSVVNQKRYTAHQRSLSPSLDRRA